MSVSRQAGNRKRRRRVLQRPPPPKKWWFETYTDPKYDDVLPSEIVKAGQLGFRGRAAMDAALSIHNEKQATE